MLTKQKNAGKKWFFGWFLRTLGLRQEMTEGCNWPKSEGESPNLNLPMRPDFYTLLHSHLGTKLTKSVSNKMQCYAFSL